MGSPQTSSPGTRSRSGEALCLPRPPAACPVPPSLSLKGQASSCPPSILPDVPVLLVNGCLEPGGVPLPGLSTAPPAPVQPSPGLSTLNNTLSAPALTCGPDSKCSAIGQLLGGGGGAPLWGMDVRNAGSVLELEDLRASPWHAAPCVGRWGGPAVLWSHWRCRCAH